MSGRLDLALAAALAVAVAAGAGWLADAPATSPPLPAPQPAPRPTMPAERLGGAAPLIAVAADGRVTLRVEQQPLDWVLEQIALQGGNVGVPARAALAMPAPERSGARTAPAALPAREPICGAASPPADPITLQHQLASGIESERFDALMHARAGAVVLPAHTLQALFETDASERVRLAAFEDYLDLHLEQSAALRQALEAALHSPSVEVRRVAGRRLVELEQRQRLAQLPAVTDP